LILVLEQVRTRLRTYIGLSGPKQFEGTSDSVCTNQCGLFEHSAEKDIHEIPARNSYSHTSLIRIRDASDRRICRDEICEVYFQISWREVCFGSSGRIDPKKRHVPCIGLETRHHSARPRVLNLHELNPDPRREFVREIDRDAPQLTRSRVFGGHDRCNCQASTNSSGFDDVNDTVIKR